MTGAAQALLAATALSSGGGGSVSITPRTVSNSGTGTGTVSVGYRLDSDGNAYKVTTAATAVETWLDSGLASAYEARATVVSGASPTGSAVGSWLALSSDLTWTVSAGAGVSSSADLTIEIRDVATHTVQADATIIITADNTGSGGGGGSGGSVSIDDHTVTKLGTAGTVLSASYKLDSDGNAYNQAATLLEAWLDSGSAGDFECRATVTGDFTPSGTLDSWLALSTDRQWVFSSTDSATTSILIEIRDATSHTVLDSATITLTISASGGGGGP